MLNFKNDYVMWKGMRIDFVYESWGKRISRWKAFTYMYAPHWTEVSGLGKTPKEALEKLKRKIAKYANR